MSRASVKASTSPSTPSAPTTCKSPPGRGLLGGRAHNYGLGHIPGNVPTVEGLQRKLEPLSFCPAGGKKRKKKKIAIPHRRRRNIDHKKQQSGGRHAFGRRMLLRRGALCRRGRPDDAGAVS